MAPCHGLKNEPNGGAAVATTPKTVDPRASIDSRGGMVPSRGGTTTPNLVVASKEGLAGRCLPERGMQPPRLEAGKKGTRGIRIPIFLGGGNRGRQKQWRLRSRGFHLQFGLFPQG